MLFTIPKQYRPFDRPAATVVKLMVPADDTNNLARILSMIAIAVAALAAIFTWWQASIAHQTRRDSGRVFLSLSYVVISDGLRDRQAWTIRNAGRGTALDVRVVVTVTLPTIQEDFRGLLDGMLAGESSAVLTFDEYPGSPENSLPAMRANAGLATC